MQAQMSRLIDWFNSSHNQTDGLVRAALAHVWLEAIHPFEDGNGRVGRALVEMALAQDLKTDKRLWSLSQQMWLDRAGYYAQLQAATGQANMDVTPWVQWFVGCVHKAFDATWEHMQTALRKTRFWAELRERSARELVDLGFDGYAIGGVSVGEPEHEMMRAVEHSVPFLPEDKPRYAMGLGTPPQILEMIARGVDMFDCVMPTRVARHGQAFTLDGPIHIKNLIFERDDRPLCESSHPHVARFSRAYIRHLFRAGEILALRLLSFHNLHFFLRLTAQAREAISEGNFLEFKESFIRRYTKSKST
jgi:tRNA-guanine transglycosylase